MGQALAFRRALQAGRVTDAETELVAVEPVVAVLRRLLPRLHLLADGWRSPRVGAASPKPAR